MAGFVRLKPSYDIVVLGGGHAGLQAGYKAGLLHQSALILDRGPKYSRSYYAPQMMNIPGFPDGISGHKLLDLQIEQVRRVSSWTSYLSPVALQKVQQDGNEFVVSFERLRTNQSVRAKVLILALGVVDRIPNVKGAIDPIFPWANQGIVDFCILCDGHSMPGRTVAVIGADSFAVHTALDLFHFRPASVSLLTHGQPLLADLEGEERSALERSLSEHHVPVLPQEIVGFDGIREKKFGVIFQDGSRETFDKGFSALGWYTTHDEIPRSLGLKLTPEGYVATDEDCRALRAEGSGTLPGVYAVGDLRDGWKQIPEAWATAERAVIDAWAFYLQEGTGPKVVEP
jgi:thioredoxin reductase (NADPH)